VSPHQRDRIERLCRYITRPALALERLSTNAAGQVVYQLKTPYRDGAAPSGQELKHLVRVVEGSHECLITIVR
jgi:hypothetical protein